MFLFSLLIQSHLFARGRKLDRAAVLNRISVDIQSRCKTARSVLHISFLSLHMSKEGVDASNCLARPLFFFIFFYPPSELESRETLVYFNFDDNDVWRQAGLRNQVYRSYPAGFISHVGYGYGYW